MKKYLILCLIVISSVAHAVKASQADSKMIHGERNQFTTDDPCQAPNIVGCGPCFKACMAQQQGDNFQEESSFAQKPAKPAGKGSVKTQ